MKKTILLVDDSRSVIKLVESYLFEFQVIGVTTGEEMWQFLETETPELILLDIILQNEDGLFLANELIYNNKYKNIPIIFISSKNTGLDVLEGLRLDVYDYVKKPFDRFELLARINATIKRKNLENELLEMTIRDPLTNCFSRNYFYDRVMQQISYFKRTEITFSIALIDIDHFKNVNDSYGHLAGDFVLSSFANILLKNTRFYDVVGRYGGEEFTILYSDCIKKNAVTALTNIKNIITASPFQYDNNEITISFSCGVVEIKELHPEEKITFEDLIKIADERLYTAKRSGRDRIVTD